VIFERTTRFKRAAKKLTGQDRERLAKALILYEADPSPSAKCPHDRTLKRP
jgi:hypothetical protein